MYKYKKSDNVNKCGLLAIENQQNSLYSCQSWFVVLLDTVNILPIVLNQYINFVFYKHKHHTVIENEDVNKNVFQMNTFSKIGYHFPTKWLHRVLFKSFKLIFYILQLSQSFLKVFVRAIEILNSSINTDI